VLTYTFKLFGFLIFLISALPGEGYSRHASCALNSLYTFVIIFFFIIMLRYKKLDKKNLQNCLRNFFFSYVVLSRSDGSAFWTFDIRIHIMVIMVIAVFIVTIPNLDGLVNHPVLSILSGKRQNNKQNANINMPTARRTWWTPELLLTEICYVTCHL